MFIDFFSGQFHKKERYNLQFIFNYLKYFFCLTSNIYFTIENNWSVFPTIDGNTSGPKPEISKGGCTLAEIIFHVANSFLGLNHPSSIFPPAGVC